MRSAPVVLSPDLPIAVVLDQTNDSAFDAWPVADEQGLLGMVRSSELEQAADDGASNQSVGELLREASWSGQTVVGDLRTFIPTTA